MQLPAPCKGTKVTASLFLHIPGIPIPFHQLLHHGRLCESRVQPISWPMIHPQL